MSTQGLVSIIDQHGKVLYKLVTGADGYYAPDVAREVPRVLKDGGAAEELAHLAIDLGFGERGSRSFIVQTRDGDFDGSLSDVTADLPPSYREHFHDPRWNPRWAQGTAEYTEVVQVATPCSSALRVIDGGGETPPELESWSNTLNPAPLTADALLEMRDEMRARAAGLPMLRDRKPR